MMHIKGNGNNPMELDILQRSFSYGWKEILSIITLYNYVGPENIIQYIPNGKTNVNVSQMLPTSQITITVRVT